MNRPGSLRRRSPPACSPQPPEPRLQPPNALRHGNGRGGKFEAREGYRKLLERVSTQAAQLLEEDAIIYARTDGREFTYRTTLAVLRTVFPDEHVVEVRRPMLRPSQTHLFDEGNIPAETNGEVDLILRPR